MEKCTKVAGQHEVHIEAVGIGVWNPQTPSSWTQFEPAVFMCSIGPVELGHHSTIPHPGCFGKPRTPLIERPAYLAVHEADRDTPPPSPLSQRLSRSPHQKARSG